MKSNTMSKINGKNMHTAGVGAPQGMSKNIFASTPLPLVFALFLSVFKLWLISGQNFYAISGASYDDFLFIRGATYLLYGAWLGNFDSLTLMKGPFYVFWLASTTALELPIFLSQHLLYVLACFIFIISIRPLVQKPIIQFMIFVILLFNPMSFSEDFTTRIIREGIYPALTLLVFSGAI